MYVLISKMWMKDDLSSHMGHIFLQEMLNHLWEALLLLFSHFRIGVPKRAARGHIPPKSLKKVKIFIFY